MRADLWLSSNSDKEKSVKWYIGSQEAKFLYKDADVIPLSTHKCINLRSFVFVNYDKVLMETGKFFDNLRVTENGLVSDVDILFKILGFRT